MFFYDYVQALKRRTSPLEDILDMQRKQLMELLKSAGIEKGNASTDEILQTLKVTDKSKLMNNYNDSLTVSEIDWNKVKNHANKFGNTATMLKSKYVVSTTSGTSGERGYFVNTKQFLNRFKAILVARNVGPKFGVKDLLYHLFGPRFRMSMIVPNNGPYISSQILNYQPKIAGILLKSKTLSIFSPIEEIVKELNRFKPHYLYAYPSILEQLALRKLEGDLCINPRVIAVSSEPLSKSTRALAKKAFNLSHIANSYSTTECLGIASECEYENMHVNIDCAILEPFTESGEYAINELSDGVYVTNLVNTVQPIIRYKLDDRVRFKDTKCKCGSAFPVIELEGRTDDTIWLKDGTGKFIPFTPIPLESIVLEFQEILSYRITHVTQNRLVVRLKGSNGNGLLTRVKDRLLSYFKENGVDRGLEVVVQEFEPYDVRTTQKIKQIENLVELPKTI